MRRLLEMGVPVVVALNMMDVARKRGIGIDVQGLAAAGLPGGADRGDHRRGPGELKARIERSRVAPSPADRLTAWWRLRRPSTSCWDCSSRRPGESSLAGASSCSRMTAPAAALRGTVRSAEHLAGGRRAPARTSDILIADSRYAPCPHAARRRCAQQRGRLADTLTDRIDSLVLSRWFGIPIFLAVMYLMFLFTINVGGAFIDFFDGVAGALFVDGMGELITAAGGPAWLRVLLADGVGGGIQVVATFIPIITALYLFLSVLEDSGYMARAAFVMDRFDARHRPARQGLRAADRRLRLQRAGDHGHPHPGERARAQADHPDEPVHVLRRAPAGVRAVRRRLLSQFAARTWCSRST